MNRRPTHSTPGIERPDMMRYRVQVRFHDGSVGWPERDDASIDRESTLRLIENGEWDKVIGVEESNVAEGTCRDVSEDFARELASRAYNERNCEVSAQLVNFIEHHAGCEITRGLEVVS